MLVNSVFTTNGDDVPGGRIETRYVFKSANLNQAEASIGHWIIYYRPTRRARAALPSGYFAMAQVEGIDLEPLRPGYRLARMAGYRGFDRTVPFKEDGHYYEAALRRADASRNRGAFGQGVRNLHKDEFGQIVAAGLTAVSADASWQFPGSAALPRPGHLYAAEDPALFVQDEPLLSVPRA
ncbi:MAG: hypothetical protein J0H20_19715, partial [Rhizobiales bacterium]|nr:hypothetical protein [Hyphomicrobiales bacterium]